MTFERADKDIRDVLHPLRARYWAKDLTEVQFKERNRRLYAHPFGQKIDTYWLKEEEGEVIASLDSLPVSLLVRDGDKIHLEKGSLLAFVVVASRFQGKGFGRELLKEYLRQVHPPYTLLFSDVGPTFYEKFGFTASPQKDCFLPAVATGAGFANKASAIPASDFCELWLTHRGALLLKGANPAAAFLAPEADFVDWRLEYYRVRAGAAGMTLPKALFWQIQHGSRAHALALAPDFKSLQLDVLYAAPKCRGCLRFAQSKSAEWHLPRVRYWAAATSHSSESELQWPMIRFATRARAALEGAQIGDWW